MLISTHDVGLILSQKWAHRDLNPGFSPCKGDVITELDYEPTEAYLVEIHLNFEAKENLEI